MPQFKSNKNHYRSKKKGGENIDRTPKVLPIRGNREEGAPIPCQAAVDAGGNIKRKKEQKGTGEKEETPGRGTRFRVRRTE